MTRQVEAVYERGVLRPLEPLALAESQRVKLTISDTAMGRYPQDLQFLEWARAEVVDSILRKCRHNCGENLFSTFNLGDYILSYPRCTPDLVSVDMYRYVHSEHSKREA